MSGEQPVRDARLTPARGDIASAALRGCVVAERFVQGERFAVRTEVADMRRRPRPDAPLDTQLLYGETVTVFEDEEGWGWAQADGDSYVGYVPMSTLGRDLTAPTHCVVVNRTFVYPAADMKRPPIAALPLGGRVCVEAVQDRFVRIAGHGFVFATHLAPLDGPPRDAIDVALGLVGVPYLWGGKSAQGIDCSGLVQLSLSLAGRTMPRDTDQQEAAGDALIQDDICQRRRGDLVFWPGHVGLLVDGVTLLHANAHHMRVVSESFDAACARIRESGLPLSSIRRPI